MTFVPTVQHVLQGVRYPFYFQIPSFIQATGEISGSAVPGSFQRLFAEKYWINSTDLIGGYHRITRVAPEKF